MKIINEEKYPWLQSPKDSDENSSFLSSSEAKSAIEAAKTQLHTTGAVSFPQFLTLEAVQHAVDDLRRCEDQAYTTDECHTAYLKDITEQICL